MKRCAPFLLAVLCTCTAVAQPPANSTRAAKKTETPARPKHQGLTVESVVSMVQAGLSDDVVIARLRKEDTAFDLSAEAMIRLKRANVSDAVIKVMLDPKAEIASRPAPSSAQPTPQVVVQVPVIPGITGSTPSGATPTPGVSASGDPDDPMTPHDSGIYLYAKDQDDRQRMTVLERAAWQGAKTGGILGSALTYGIKKAKTKAVIQGPNASIRANDPNPVFYFYFDDKATGLGKSYFGLSNVSNPNQFALLRLEVAKSNRETIIGEYNAYGASSGTSEKSMVGFRSERIRPGLYKVVMNTPLQPGEYCFLASTGTLGVYGAGAAGAADLFDFGVSSNR